MFSRIYFLAITCHIKGVVQEIKHCTVPTEIKGLSAYYMGDRYSLCLLSAPPSDEGSTWGPSVITQSFLILYLKIGF